MTPGDVAFQGAGLTLRGLEWPDDATAPPRLALHGWLDNAASFQPLLEHLGGHCLALDFAGHGHSDHRPAGTVNHLLDNVRDVLTVLDERGWQQVDLIGHSMGAGIACLFAAACPERVRRLVLIEGLGPLSTEPEQAATTLRQSLDDMNGLAGKSKPVYPSQDKAIAARTRGFGGLTSDCAALLCQRGLKAVEGGWTWRADSRLRTTSMLRLSEEQVEGFIRAVQAPVCLILAEQGMGGTGRFDTRLSWLNQPRIVSLPGRHHLHMEAPQPVADTIDDFLAN